jgi:hypothetical protein
MASQGITWYKGWRVLLVQHSRFFSYACPFFDSVRFSSCAVVYSAQTSIVPLPDRQWAQSNITYSTSAGNDPNPTKIFECLTARPICTCSCRRSDRRIERRKEEPMRLPVTRLSAFRRLFQVIGSQYGPDSSASSRSVAG